MLPRWHRVTELLGLRSSGSSFNPQQCSFCFHDNQEYVSELLTHVWQSERESLQPMNSSPGPLAHVSPLHIQPEYTIIWF